MRVRGRRAAIGWLNCSNFKEVREGGKEHLSKVVLNLIKWRDLTEEGSVDVVLHVEVCRRLMGRCHLNTNPSTGYLIFVTLYLFVLFISKC